MAERKLQKYIPFSHPTLKKKKEKRKKKKTDDAEN
jgi:hypothetical protein